MEALLAGLNDAQKCAVTTPASVVQVLAPPGSGKTKTLTARVAYLITHEGLKPWNIIVCTFTKKAANEMKDRIREIVGEGVERKLILGTFHSVARRFLKKYGQEIGIPNSFEPADEATTKAIIRRIIEKGQYTVDPKRARTRISTLKAKGTTAEQFAATTKQVDDHEFANVYSEYEERLKMANLLDFDDLLLRCTHLLQKRPECVSSIEAVLIDEYQDTNNVQYELMTLLARRLRRITIVGDPDQSIYGFRSAEIENLYRMQREYPESLIINLENNYRSSGCILNSAMAVIEQDETRPSKSLQATHCVGEQPTLRHLSTAFVEAQWITQEIKRSKTLTAGLLNYNDYAILLRSASLSRSIENAFVEGSIPYRMVGGTRFFDRAEVKTILDYLRVINEPSHSDALVRVINTPSRGIGDVTVKMLLEEAESKKMTLWSLIRNCAQGKTSQTKISSSAQKGIDLFVGVILSSRQKLLPKDGQDCYLLELIHHVLQKISFVEHLKKTFKDDWKDRWENVEELITQAAQLASTVGNGEIDNDALPVVEGIQQRQNTAGDVLSEFLANVALSAATDAPDGERLEQVTISTIHAAKGLEWPIVFIPAVYDGSIPHSRSDDHDEERRLLYVGMTRAQGLLYLSCPVKQSQSGQEETTLSKFISSPSIQRLFSTRGPSIGCSTITDLAQILRRPCPLNTHVEAARSLLERIDDDKYPVDRENIDGDDPGYVYGDGQPSYKRQKLQSSHMSGGITASVTMQQTSTFSVAKTTLQNGTSGFTTARTQHKIIQEAIAVGALSTASSLSVGKTEYRKKQKVEMEATKTAGGKPVKPRPAGQGSITSFFKRPTQMVSQEPEPAIPKIPTVSRSYSSSSNKAPLSDISNVQPPTTRPYSAPKIANRQLLNSQIMSKPKNSDSQADMESTRHALLSSSPVKPSDHSGNAENEDDPDESVSPSKPATEAAALSFSGVRPASTFHTTSVSQLQNNSLLPRKTLGMRRSMQGWNVKHQQPPRPQK